MISPSLATPHCSPRGNPSTGEHSGKIYSKRDLRHVLWLHTLWFMQLSTKSRHLVTASVLALSSLTFGQSGLANASTIPPAPAPAADVVADMNVGPRLRELTINSPAMNGEVKARILLPVSWEQNPNKPRPVLYLLHGANGDESSWTKRPGLQELLAPYDVIVIMPNGGKAGFYSNWHHNNNGPVPAYETHHLVELRQILEGRYHANGRYAIVGASMGGFGTMSYAARHPDMFAAASSISGALDLGVADPLGLQSLVGVAGVRAPIDLTAIWGPRGSGEVAWRAHNPADLASNLDEVQLRVGGGNGVPRASELRPEGRDPDDPGIAQVTTLETGTLAMSKSFVKQLDRFDIDVTTDFYGAGLHTGPYFMGQLERSLPMLMSALRKDRPIPKSFRYRSGEMNFSVWGWKVTTSWEEPTFTDLVVDGRELYLSGRGEATITTPEKFRPGKTYKISNRRISQEVVADANGSLSFTLDLGDSARDYREPLRDRPAKRPLRSIRVAISPA